MDRARLTLPRPSGSPLRANGAILLLALLFLLLIGMVSGAVVHSGTLQVRLALNEQLHVGAMQDARMLAQALLAEPENFLADQPVGTARCRTIAAEHLCDVAGLKLPVDLSGWEAGEVDFRVRRSGPEVALMPAGSAPAHERSGHSLVPVALFEIEVLVDRAHLGLGTAEAIRGVALVLPEDAYGEGVSQRSVPVGVGDTLGVYWRYPQYDPL